ncbi:hypothetical protein BGP77_06675 [Saccharospirillum sp. MSK14-1]|nr:hypothetical protein BGP77_06675 [Saccharospirillum sp. MSK14-1]
MPNTFAAGTANSKEDMSDAPFWFFGTAAASWLVYEGGQYPQYAQYFYGILALNISQRLDDPKTRALFAGTTAMTATNIYYAQNPPEDKTIAGWANVGMFYLSIGVSAGLNGLLTANNEAMDVGFRADDEHYRLSLNYRF